MESKLALIFFLIINFHSYGQTADDVLMNGIEVKPGNEIFLKYSDKKFKYNVGKGKKDEPQKFISLEETNYFLVWDKSVNVYLQPVNPLNFVTTSETKVTIDPLAEESHVALEQVISMLQTLPGFAVGAAPATRPASSSAGFRQNDVSRIEQASVCTVKIEDIKSKLESIQSLINEDKKKEIIKIFDSLNELTFEEVEVTKTGVEKANTSIENVGTHYEKLSTSISELEKLINGFTCDDKFQELVIRNLVSLVIKDLNTNKEIQIKRLSLLKQMYDLVNKAYTQAIKVKDGIVSWYLHLEEVNAQYGNINDFIISISEGGFNSKGEEIVPVDNKNLITNTLRIRRFQRFVTEIMPGVAFTDLRFPKFGTVTGEDGITRVADAGEEKFRKLNFAAMVNFNLHLSNSPAHPFLQLGIGANTGYPTFFTGTGVRFRSSSSRRLAISVGFASTWIRTLNDLSIGDKVSGTAEIEEHITHEFNWPPKPYIGIQFKL